MQDLFTNRLARDKKNEGKEEKHRVFRRCNFATQLHSQSMQLRYRRLQKSWRWWWRMAVALFSSQQCTDYYKKSLDSFDTFPERERLLLKGSMTLVFLGGWLLHYSIDSFFPQKCSTLIITPQSSIKCVLLLLFLFAIVHRELGENDHRCHSSLGSSELMGHLIIYNPYYYNNYCYCIGEPAALLLGEESNKSIACSNTAYNATIPTFPLLLTV